jgi:hypothetical protein
MKENMQPIPEKHKLNNINTLLWIWLNFNNIIILTEFKRTKYRIYNLYDDYQFEAKYYNG